VLLQIDGNATYREFAGVYAITKTFGGGSVRRFNCLVAILFSALLVGCDRDSLIKKFTPPEDESNARNYVDLVRQGKFDQVEPHLDPSIADANIGDTLAKVAAFFPAENPESIKVVGVDVSQGQELTTTSITLEYQFPSKWLLVNVATQRKDDVTTILGFHVNTTPDSLENLYRFTLVGKSAIQYLILALAVCSLLFSGYVLVICVRTRALNRKWLWALFVLVGIGRLAINWTTGQCTFNVLSIRIPCAQASANFYGPWTVAVYLPLGAILFLNHRWKMRVTGELIDPPTHGPT
jgi:hypothetical protein